MAYGGPLAGCLGGWVCLLGALQLNLPWLVGVASATFVINLFNLIPVPPLDGGRICAAVSHWFWFVGILLLGAALLFFHSVGSIVIVVLVFIFALPRLRATLFQPHTAEMQRYYGIALSNRFTMALMYLGLIAALILGYWDASQHLRYLSEG
jgi:Zn-dependent protease